ncbi:Fur family transcriptional regulator [Trichloromonas sp.]|uniref:Fur family transcriptional regulator n=1 Tax=Trichloromonas sp. TaxID=3069249 RepID=UPI002A48A3D9|nr:transcriptional repressor [Trichloromonas sp.]
MPDTVNIPGEKLAALEEALKAAGLRLTHQRLEIYRELLAATDHPSAECLYQRLRRRIPTLSLDTVYRTLATLAAHGLINRVETLESQARFEATSGRHHHLICRKCGKIADFQWPDIDSAALPQEISEWGRIDLKNVVIHGICRTCLERREK